MQEDLRENCCLRSIGQELERVHALCLHISKPHTSTTMANTHTVSQMKENFGENYSLRSIAQELERLCSAIDGIEDAHLKEEKKRMDYSFYGSSPSPSRSTASSSEGPAGDEAATPSAAVEDESINNELFEEYFGSYLTHGSTQSRHLSLHVPTHGYGARRSYSQTLV